MNRPLTTSDVSAARPTGPRIVLFVEDGSGDWHARRLKAAMEAKGAEVVTTTLSACAFDTACPSGMDIPGFGGLLPDGAFVRSVSTGTLEQITFRLGILHALRESGVRVWNDARTIERCVDKSTATFLFQKAGLATPATRVVETRERALQRTANLSGPLVVKPLFGSQGNGVQRVANTDALPPPDEVNNVYYVQPYLRAEDATHFEDWRVLVSNGAMLSAMVRRGTSWVTNVHQGAQPVAHEPCSEMRDLALGAVAAIGADYAGVDLIRDTNGRLMVLEINSNPAWKGLQAVSPGIDIAEVLARDFLASVVKTRA